MPHTPEPEFSLRTWIIGWAVIVVALLGYGTALVPADGVVCHSGNGWGVNEHGVREECPKIRERIGATCDARMPHCFFVQWPAEVRARAEQRGFVWR